MEECHIEARIGEQRVTLAGGHPRYLRGFHDADLAGEPVVRLAAPLPSGSVYLDVGANVGVTAIAVALSRPDLRVVAFEPVPSNAECLRRNLSSNGIANCIMVNAAVGSRDGRTTVNDDGPWSRVGLPGPEVPVVTLDGWCAEHLGSAAVGLIKIDVEGYEPHVLAGAVETIARWQPRIFMELNPACLLLQRVNPVAFGRHLIAAFEVMEPPEIATDSAVELVSRAVTVGAGFPDLVLRPRGDAPGCNPAVLETADGALAADASALLAAVAAPASGAAAGRIAHLESECGRLASALARATAQAESMDHLESELLAIRASRSWRATAPLRALRRRIARAGINNRSPAS